MPNMRRVLSTWWPLAASWLLMGAELPALSAVVARLANPEINLAAYGGIVFPLALIIESPIIMLLAASTALSRDQASYQKIYRWMMRTGLALTALHLLLAFTPAYDWVALRLLGAPAEIIAPARIGLMIMTPWTWSIAYRRFHQGVLIRFGRSNTVTAGTVIRLVTDLSVLGVGYLLGFPGIIVATSAVAAGVISEAIYVGVVVRPVLAGPLRQAEAVSPALELPVFLRFYIPLVLTSLLSLIANPIISAAVSRMPQAIPSLAVLPVVNGLAFMLRALGIAYNEVVVALLDEPGSSLALRRFTAYLASGASLVLLLLAATPLAYVWFHQVSGLSLELSEMARLALWLAVPIPALNTLQSWYQGAILFGRHTRGITESVAIYLVSNTLLLIAAVAWAPGAGIYAALGCVLVSTLLQTAWQWYRARPVMAQVALRDQAG